MSHSLFKRKLEVNGKVIEREAKFVSFNAGLTAIWLVDHLLILWISEADLLFIKLISCDQNLSIQLGKIKLFSGVFLLSDPALSGLKHKAVIVFVGKTNSAPFKINATLSKLLKKAIDKQKI